MKYIKYNGYNGFETYGFVKDNTHKLDMWKVRIKKRLKLFSNEVNMEIYLNKGEYLYIDEYAQYTNRLKKSTHFPILLILVSKWKKFINSFNINKDAIEANTNAVKDFLND
jgi:hypothetical protein